MRTRTESEEESSQIPVAMWVAEASDLPKEEEGKVPVYLLNTYQAGLTTVCPPQMKKPFKQ